MSWGRLEGDEIAWTVVGTKRWRKKESEEPWKSVSANKLLPSERERGRGREEEVAITHQKKQRNTKNHDESKMVTLGLPKRGKKMVKTEEKKTYSENLKHFPGKWKKWVQHTSHMLSLSLSKAFQRVNLKTRPNWPLVSDLLFMTKECDAQGIFMHS